MATSSTQRRIRRHGRIRSLVSGTKERPRLSVYKSNTQIYAQLIDDDAGTTLAQANTAELKRGSAAPVEAAREAGGLLAKRAKEAKIARVVFDRGGFRYTGRIKALADGARTEGLEF